MVDSTSAVRFFDDRGKVKNYIYMRSVLFENEKICLCRAGFGKEPDKVILFSKESGEVLSNNFQFWYAENCSFCPLRYRYLPLKRYVYKPLIADKLVTVQPMSRPSFKTLTLPNFGEGALKEIRMQMRVVPTVLAMDSEVIKWYKGVVQKLGRRPTLREEDIAWKKHYKAIEDKYQREYEAEYRMYYGEPRKRKT